MCWFTVLIKNMEGGDMQGKKIYYISLTKVIFLICKYDKRSRLCLNTTGLLQ